MQTFPLLNLCKRPYVNAPPLRPVWLSFIVTYYIIETLTLKTLCLFVLLAFYSCETTRALDESPEPESRIQFLVLSIERNSDKTKSTVRLIRKSESTGTIKRKAASEDHAPEMLTLYLLNEQRIIDSTSIAHPLYRHFEYPDQNGQFVTKDTILKQAEFFVRFQTTEPATELKVLEQFNQSPPRAISTIRL